MQVVGQYTKRDVSLARYIAPNFTPHKTFAVSCGEQALQVITGKGFTRRENQLYRDTLRRNHMTSILRKRGYKVFPLSLCRVTNCFYPKNTVLDSHLVLNVQIFKRNEASWSICHKNMYCHNGVWEASKILEFINRPVIASYVVWHKKWSY